MNKTNHYPTVRSIVSTKNTSPSNLLMNVSSDTVKAQFEKLLDSRKLTEKAIAGKVVSLRTAQALIETMVQFIVARFQVWCDPEGTTSLTLYDDDNLVSYNGIIYNYEIVDFADKLDKDGFAEVLGSIFTSTLSSLKVRRQDINYTFTCSSSSSSCSSSCSSSSCSSSCSSSSSSSSCSSIFIAYMKIAG